MSQALPAGQWIGLCASDQHRQAFQEDCSHQIACFHHVLLQMNGSGPCCQPNSLGRSSREGSSLGSSAGSGSGDGGEGGSSGGGDEPSPDDGDGGARKKHLSLFALLATVAGFSSVEAMSATRQTHFRMLANSKETQRFGLGKIPASSGESSDVFARVALFLIGARKGRMLGMVGQLATASH